MYARLRYAAKATCSCLAQTWSGGRAVTLHAWMRSRIKSGATEAVASLYPCPPLPPPALSPPRSLPLSPSLSRLSVSSLFLCLSVCLPVCPPVSCLVHLCVSLFFRLSASRSSLHLSIYPSLSLFSLKTTIMLHKIHVEAHTHPALSSRLTKSGLHSCSHAGPVHASTHPTAAAAGARAAAAAAAASTTGKKNVAAPAAAAATADPSDTATAAVAATAAALHRGSGCRKTASRRPAAASAATSARLSAAPTGRSIWIEWLGRTVREER